MKPTRSAALLAMTTLLAASGCQGGPFAWTLDLGAAGGLAPPTGVARTMGPNVGLVAPVAPTRSPVSPAGSVAPSAMASAPASAAPTALPAAEPSFEPPAPDASLPPAQTYSDVEPAEQAAVEQALASDLDLAAYLPADLIHDGGVVLFRLLQAGFRPIASNTTLGPPPADWSRVALAKSGTQLKLRKGCLDGPDCEAGKRPVRATVEVLQRGEFRGNGQERRYGELVRRQIVLRPTPEGLKLAEASPMTIETQGGRSGLEIRRLTVSGAGPKPVYDADVMKVVKVEDEPRLRRGERLRVEVEVETRRPGTTFVFASRAGDGKSRVLLLDDGQAPDRADSDFRWTGALVAASTPGLHHLVIDVIDPDSFLPNKRYRAFSVAIAYRVE